MNFNHHYLNGLARNRRIGERSITGYIDDGPSTTQDPMSAHYSLPISVINQGSGDNQRIGDKIALRRLLFTLAVDMSVVSNPVGPEENLNLLYNGIVSPLVCRVTCGKYNRTIETNTFDVTVPVWEYLDPAYTGTVPVPTRLLCGALYNDEQSYIFLDEAFTIKASDQHCDVFPTKWREEGFIEFGAGTWSGASTAVPAHDHNLSESYQIHGLCNSRSVCRDYEVVFDPPILVTYQELAYPDMLITSAFSPVIQLDFAWNTVTDYSPLSTLRWSWCLRYKVEWDDGFYASNLRSRFRGLEAAANNILDPDDPRDQGALAAIASVNAPVDEDGAFERPLKRGNLREYPGIPSELVEPLVVGAERERRIARVRMRSSDLVPAFDESRVGEGGRDARRVRVEDWEVINPNTLPPYIRYAGDEEMIPSSRGLKDAEQERRDEHGSDRPSKK